MEISEGEGPLGFEGRARTSDEVIIWLDLMSFWSVQPGSVRCVCIRASYLIHGIIYHSLRASKLRKSRMLHARHLEPLQFIGNDFLVVFVGCDVQKRRRGGGKLFGFSTCPRQYPRPRLALPPLKSSSTSSYVSNPKSSLPMPFP